MEHPVVEEDSSARKVKQTIVMRKTYNGKGIHKGKMVAQGAHAAMKDVVLKYKEILELNSQLKLAAIAFLTGGSLDDLLYQINKLPTKETILEHDRLWYYGNFKKICLGVEDEEQLIKLFEDAKAKGLNCHMIVDSGETEFNGVQTRTCFAIGPHFSEEIDEITKDLKPL